MKNRLIPLFLTLILFLVAGTWASRGQSVTNLFTWTNVTASITAPVTNGGGVIAATVYVPTRTYYIQSGGIPLGTTNSLIGNEQVSWDGSNWFTIGQYQPVTTNLTFDTAITPAQPITFYNRLQIITTNTMYYGTAGK